MTTELDLRDRPADEYRAAIYDALDDGDGDLDVLADRDVDPHLVRYQFDRERALTWSYDHPDAEPRSVSVSGDGSLSDGEPPAIDVRDLKPQRRHEVLLTIFEELSTGEGFVLVNDHDPKPLYYELRSLHGDVVGWDYRSEEAEGWRVGVSRTGDSIGDREGLVTRYDVRDIPKPDRHPTIHHRYGMLPAGGTMELIAPHEPRPLRREFVERYGDGFDWDVREDEPGRCRVHVTKADEERDTAGSETESDSTEEDVGSDAAEDDETLTVTDELDVRELPPARRHELIFDAYADLDAGEAFVLVNDHDPKPLYYQFAAEAGPAFRWAYQMREPGEWRVRVGKAAGEAAEGEGDRVGAPF